ncbi:substrate-binding domain-containing protein [Granulosicoccus antarcticus]|uniref:HTH-type transcriptional repressor PurR n=1 Tax=Granulosicoccus antarcticus IMCC3135 TaxID=1192854 RepID=A0A2Z2NPY1_9GAMM|nr:substrate-binding domain-containing protein [Granulosicoccus antarcticus]ASJ71718.1 HTH-type transcriptional repressor PurR [Granulosicoccus antarcticus IMCC3135]
MASALLETTAPRVGLMIELTGSASLLPLVDAAVARLESNGFETIVVAAGRSARDEQTAWEVLARSHCDGIIMHSDCLSNDQLARLISTRKNVVHANLNNTQLGTLAAAHLITKGHRRIAMVSGPTYRYSVQHTLEGFMQTVASQRSGDIEMQTLEATLDEEGGANAMNILLNSKHPPTAVFLQNDRMAMGAFSTCQQNGVRMPHDMSILGCGDLCAAAHTRPTLSTIRQPLARIGEHAAQRVMNMINNMLAKPADEQGTDWAMPTIIPRNSVRDRNNSANCHQTGDGQISARERECLEWASKGKTSWEISQILGVTESTIIYHLRNATRKLNAANRLHAVAKALQASIIDF